MSTHFERLGGHEGVWGIVDDFVERVFADVMIGFHFRDADRRRIKQKEFEHAAEHLGGPVRYAGRPLDRAHAPHPILGGQFERRLQILRDTLEDAGAPGEVVEHWLAHDRSLRHLITPDPDGRCEGSGGR